MPYNRDIHSRAPLPSGALPTDDEITALVGHGRRLQSEAFWRALKRLFVGSERETAPPPSMPLGIRRKPIWRLLDRLGFDVDQLGQDNYAGVMAMLSKRCGNCTNADKCHDWLEAGRADNGYRRFCPNASLFGVLPRRAALR